jgi:hypothetical protein
MEIRAAIWRAFAGFVMTIPLIVWRTLSELQADWPPQWIVASGASRYIGRSNMVTLMNRSG